MTETPVPEKVATYRRTPSRAGRLALSFYRLAYRHGRPRWDSTEPHHEVKELATGRQPGRALDLGCGTGADATYLANHGWDVVGVDFVPEAIEIAKTKAHEAGASPFFLVGDVTRLREAGVAGPFDVIMDTGCYHGIGLDMRDAYAREVTALAAPQADYYVAGISNPPATWRLLGARGVDADDLRRHFGATFDLVEERQAGTRGRSGRFVFYHLVRRRESCE